MAAKDSSSSPDFIPLPANSPDFIPLPAAKQQAKALDLKKPVPSGPPTIPGWVSGSASQDPTLQAGIAGAKRMGGEIQGAAKDLEEGNLPAAGVHAIQAIPFIGAGIQKGVEAMPPSDTLGHGIGKAFTTPGVLKAAGETALETAPIALGAADIAMPGRPLLGRIPSKAHAGGVLNDISSKAGSTPVPTGKTMAKLGDYENHVLNLGTKSPELEQLKGQLQPPNPRQFNYNDARGTYSNLTEASKKPGFLRRQFEPRGEAATRGVVGGVAKEGLHQDIIGALKPQGLDVPYQDALQEYARRAALDRFAKKLGLGVGTAASASQIPGARHVIGALK